VHHDERGEKDERNPDEEAPPRAVREGRDREGEDEEERAVLREKREAEGGPREEDVPRVRLLPEAAEPRRREKRERGDGEVGRRQGAVREEIRLERGEEEREERRDAALREIAGEGKP
jgi:hypothetical protein